MNDLPSAVFARRMRQERTRAGFTQSEIARRISDRLGVTIDGSAVTRVEKGERVIRLDEAVAIADVLDVPLDALLSDEDPSTRRIEELRRELAQHEWRAYESRQALEQAEASIAAVEREIARLEAMRRGAGGAGAD